MKQTTLFDKTNFKVTTHRIHPPIKETWQPPRDFPNLKNHKGPIAIDVETFDPLLLTHGPGWATKTGNLVGISVAVSRKKSWYFPMRHTVGEHNMDPAAVLRWARDNLSGNQDKIGANLLYDVGWLRAEGVHVGGRWIDVQHAEAILRETLRTYSLDSLSKRYIGHGKVSDSLYAWASAVYGGKIGPEQRKNIYRCPANLIGEYAEADAWEVLLIWKQQKKLLRYNSFETVFDLEQRLLPMLLEMRLRGVKIDMRKATKARDKLLKAEKKAQKRLKKLTGIHVNVNAAASIERALIPIGLKIEKTTKGNSSFTKTILQNYRHPVTELILDIRKYQKIRTTFIENALIGKSVNGRLYCQFHPLRNDDGGAVSGRLSSSTPNLQNIPSRDPLCTKLLRGCFVPDDGFSTWWRGDSSQIEYRFLAHFAVGKGAKRIRKQYNKNPNTDYHQATIDEIHAITSILLQRKPAKTINFGLIYGMGKEKLAATLGLSKKKTKELFSAYHEGVPFAHTTFKHYADIAAETGEVRTILGRRSTFEVYEPMDQDRDNPIYARSFSQAQAMFGAGTFRRAFTHKALNRVLQGSAADHLKKMMVKTYESGVYDALGGVPALTVHDELDGSCNWHENQHREALKEIKRIWETCMKIKVPILADFEIGKNWGNTKEVSL